MSFVIPSADTALFKQFSLERLLDNSSTDFDLFLQIEDHLILYSGNGYRWTRQELHELMHNGIKWFFIRPSDFSRAEMYEKVARLPAINKNEAPPIRLQSIHDVAKTFTQYLYEGELTPTCIDKAQMIAQSLAECIKEEPGCIKEISGLNDHDQYTYLHSVRVATYALSIAIQMGITDDKNLQDIALGGILHDIGKTMIPLQLLNKSGPLTTSEWNLMREHPQFGFDKLQDLVIGHVPREIALHHHEKLNGKGYPDALEASSIIAEVQIATLADVFDALTSSRSYQNKRSRYEALDFIKHKLLRTEISVDVFKALIECLMK